MHVHVTAIWPIKYLHYGNSTSDNDLALRVKKIRGDTVKCLNFIGLTQQMLQYVPG